MGKYIYIKNSRINLDMKLSNSKILDDDSEYSELIELSGTNIKNVMRIANNLLVHYKEYDILDTSIRKFKNYHDLITIKFYI